MEYDVIMIIVDERPCFFIQTFSGRDNRDIGARSKDVLYSGGSDLATSDDQSMFIPELPCDEQGTGRVGVRRRCSFHGTMPR